MPPEDNWDSGVPYHSIEVTVTDNPVVARPYALDGSVLVEIYERQPIGFRVR